MSKSVHGTSACVSVLATVVPECSKPAYFVSVIKNNAEVFFLKENCVGRTHAHFENSRHSYL